MFVAVRILMSWDIDLLILSEQQKTLNSGMSESNGTPCFESPSKPNTKSHCDTLYSTWIGIRKGIYGVGAVPLTRGELGLIHTDASHDLHSKQCFFHAFKESRRKRGTVT